MYTGCQKPQIRMSRVLSQDSLRVGTGAGYLRRCGMAASMPKLAVCSERSMVGSSGGLVYSVTVQVVDSIVNR